MSVSDCTDELSCSFEDIKHWRGRNSNGVPDFWSSGSDAGAQVIGAGMGRTGTTTLHRALEILGIAPVHDWQDLNEPESATSLWIEQLSHRVNQLQNNKFGEIETCDSVWDTAEQWDRVLGRYSAIVDAPGLFFVAELARAYPDAKVILTVRDSAEEWCESWRRTVYETQLRNHSLGARVMDTLCSALGRAGKMYRIRQVLNANVGSRPAEPIPEWYESHNAWVRSSVDPDRLLEFNVTSGWEPLCNFVGKPIPHVPFPHVNGRKDYLEREKMAWRSIETNIQALVIATTAVIMLGASVFFFT